MNGPYDVRLTQGHVLRHAPAQSPQGRDAAVIDIAQDLLLRHLSERGVLRLVAFKGGTALRKAYAGAAGRFSTDLDFSVATLDDDPASVTQLLVGEIDGTRLGPFSYDIEDRRGRHTIIYRSELGPDPPVISGRRSTSGRLRGWHPPYARGWTCRSTAATAVRSPNCLSWTWPKTSPRRFLASTDEALPATRTTWCGWPARPASI